MTIQRKTLPAFTKTDANADAFVGAAPDAPKALTVTNAEGVYNKGVPKGRKRQITLTIAPELLRKVDEVAKRSGQARAAVINMALYRALEGDIFK